MPNQEAIARGSSKSKITSSKQKRSTETGLYSYHPTKAHKDALRSGEFPLEQALDYLSKMFQRDCTLSCGYKPETDAYWLILRAKTDDWRTAPAFGVFSGDMEKAIRMLAYGLSRLSPEFPEDLPSYYINDDDW